ncbi:MAG TPA: LacI family DNA-binding transcriptional regulator [Anaerolineales bacterium]|nr:LacI family DNA-binding transcriptional regulator [Anaerolineales bacterium]
MNVRRVTSQDVARAAGVSRTTVSLVLNNVEAQISVDTRQRVLEAAKQLNYHPNASARRLVQGRTRVIGFVEHHSPYQSFADAFMAEVLRGLHAVARQYNYHIIYEPTSDDDRDPDYHVKLVQERHVDGIIYSGPRLNDVALESLAEANIPVVLQGHLPGCPFSSVDIDNISSAKLATDYLIGLGHTQIAMITNGPLIYSAATDRLTGYTLALQAAGIEVNNDWIRIGSFTPDSGFQAMQSLLREKSRPSAVFVASDVVAMGAVEAIHQADLRIPEDISIIGFDNIPWVAYLNPPLTTINVPAHTLGWSAGLLLIQTLENDNFEHDNLLLDTELIVRHSCGNKREAQSPIVTQPPSFSSV